MFDPRHGADRRPPRQDLRWLEGRVPAGHPYWLSTVEAADVLGVTRERVRQLAAADRRPCVVHAGRRYHRRHQVEVIANARESRRAR
jgi:hypothetical protein